MNSHLQPSINLGLDEDKFWNMTVAEVTRYQEGALWRLKLKAQYDYALADLIGISSARMMNSELKYPTIQEAYPNLFPKEEASATAEEDIVTQNKNRFLAFAQKHNAKMKKGEGET